MNTIQSEWVSCAEKCVHPSASPTQLIESKRMFYAGAMSMLSLIEATDEQSNAAAQAMIEAVIEELNQFNTDVQEGRA